jgi:hypothetical protein
VITLTEIATDAEPQTIAAGFLIAYAVLRLAGRRLRRLHRRHLRRRADRRQPRRTAEPISTPIGSTPVRP